MHPTARRERSWRRRAAAARSTPGSPSGTSTCAPPTSTGCARSTSTCSAWTSSRRHATCPAGGRPATCCSCRPAAITTTSASTPGSRPAAGRSPTASPGCTTSPSATRPAPALADALRRLREVDWPIRQATDHGTHEAIYLSDPDGNDLELMRDRPPEQWPRDAEGHIGVRRQRARPRPAPDRGAAALSYDSSSALRTGTGTGSASRRWRPDPPAVGVAPRREEVGPVLGHHPHGDDAHGGVERVRAGAGRRRPPSGDQRSRRRGRPSTRGRGSRRCRRAGPAGGGGRAGWCGGRGPCSRLSAGRGRRLNPEPQPRPPPRMRGRRWPRARPGRPRRPRAPGTAICSARSGGQPASAYRSTAST